MCRTSASRSPLKGQWKLIASVPEQRWMVHLEVNEHGAGCCLFVLAGLDWVLGCMA